MFKNPFRAKKTEDDPVLSAVTLLHQQMDLRFKEMSAQMRELELGITQLETKLLTKDLKDKQAYGLLHYKLHESKSPKLDDEISELQKQLKKDLRT